MDYELTYRDWVTSEKKAIDRVMDENLLDLSLDIQEDIPSYRLDLEHDNGKEMMDHIKMTQIKALFRKLEEHVAERNCFRHSVDRDMYNDVVRVKTTLDLSIITNSDRFKSMMKEAINDLLYMKGEEDDYS